MIKVLYPSPRTTHCVRVIQYYADTVSANYSTLWTPCSRNTVIREHAIFANISMKSKYFAKLFKRVH